ncbi:MAG: STAS domain-containing protein [Acidimicrobiia bacterium]
MSPDQTMVEVRFLEIPIEIWHRATAHQEAVQRELDIIRASLPDSAAPSRLQALSEDLDLRFPGAGDVILGELQSAAARGQATLDLVVKVPQGIGSVARELIDVMEEVDDYCRSGEALLSVVTPPDVVRFREWFLGELTRQIEEGMPPMAWRQYAEEAGDELPEPEPGPSIQGDGATEGRMAFHGELDLSTAGELQNLIIERRAAGVEMLDVDLTGVTFIDSVGLSLLVSAHNRLSEDGGHLRILLPKRLRPLFEISGLSGLLDLEFQEPG